MLLREVSLFVVDKGEKFQKVSKSSTKQNKCVHGKNGFAERSKISAGYRTEK